MRHALCCLALLLPAFARAGGPDPSIGGPGLGFVFDSAAGALRPIRGLPGAATVGAPLDLGRALTRAAISPRQDSALALAAGDAHVVWVRLDAAAPAAVLLDGADPAPDRIVYSASGASAALYYGAADRIQTVRGLPAAPVLGAPIDLGPLGAAPSALAISDDGRAVLASAARASAAPVYLLPAPSALCAEAPEDCASRRAVSRPRLLFSARHVSALSFVAGRSGVLVADDLDDRVYFLRGLAGAAANLVASAQDGIAGPIALALSDDASRAFAVNARTGTVTSIDLGGAAPPSTAACRCDPTVLERLAGDRIFRLTALSDQPLWLLDAAGSAARLFFVPAPESLP
jgi:hypothetical protein